MAQRGGERKQNSGLSWTPLRKGCGLDDYAATDDVSGGSQALTIYKNIYQIFILWNVMHGSMQDLCRFLDLCIKYEWMHLIDNTNS